ncbi:DNA adenine methylase [Helicobacter baculiformis]|uniref:site-specific DNA-methyltransferase (adenine-specific) n=1 Tax=Helicobacter baculiformis TaxID=427351 RepID=A0ABV7ZKM8_9HELI|nr:DNA adenine methylase [Helicobacter baculiformis]
MNYIGSKVRLSSFLFNHIEKVVRSRGVALQECRFLDLFAGTCAVGKLFKDKVQQVLSNDREFYSFVLAKHYIENSNPLPRVPQLIEILNTIPPFKGKIYTHYALGGGAGRQYFSDTNAMKIDAIRLQLNQWQAQKRISEQEFYFLLASLLESSDKVANTASLYGAFLKKLKKSAQQDFILHPVSLLLSPHAHHAFQSDAQTLLRHVSSDILYLDPPYNAREYGANYHLLNSIALYDDFIPQGKTGLRPYEKSVWCQRKMVAGALEDILKSAKARFIFLSYNNEGLLPLEQIQKIFNRHGKYSLASQQYKRFKADTKRPQTQKKTTEYLHILEKY